MKKRIIGLDILRVIGVIFIFCYHFTDSYVLYGGKGERIFDWLSFFSILSRPASLFLFIISGYALMYNRENELPLRDYCLRRFKGLYIPFYVAYGLMVAIGAVLLGWRPWKMVPLYKIIFTILGIDGLVANFTTDYYLIGEWFMSCIVICYLLFPVLAYLIKRDKYVTFVGLLLIYLFIGYFINPIELSVFTNPLFILVYFYVGMLCHELLANGGTPKWVKAGCLVAACGICIFYIIAGFLAHNKLMMLSENGLEFLDFIWALSMIVLFRDMNLSEGNIFAKIIRYLSQISWYVILVHHVLAFIYFNKCGASKSILKDFVIILVLSIIFAELVRYISTIIKRLLFRKN